MYIHGSYFSKILNRKKSYIAVLPDTFNDETRTLFLLHGISSDETVWSLNVPLEQYALKYNTAFFCPSGENSFYTDHADGENYGEAIGKEFFEKMKVIYKLNFTHKKTEIAGFSMGGYGAVLLGLRYPELYCRIGAFSPAFVFYKKERKDPLYQHVFSKGDYGSENDCVKRYELLVEKGVAVPSIQFTCGDQDPLYEQTQIVIEKLKKIDSNADLDFLGQKGFHNFDLWNQALVRFLET
ncbi:hypothetical protein JZO77_15830 [Enterococcus hulanensis]|uniref:alpha/beta hydrolase n=1 Tax=Enterococcus hulanensis TaxID=2559929 RepID=UPI001A8E46CD|nr:alpha/beta hydrolase-fold protein [Enterococcus hulanensis]MBO0458206.1 hypothetical protein [Enterococcus hulanensis]